MNRKDFRPNNSTSSMTSQDRALIQQHKEDLKRNRINNKLDSIHSVRLENNLYYHIPSDTFYNKNDSEIKTAIKNDSEYRKQYDTDRIRINDKRVENPKPKEKTKEELEHELLSKEKVLKTFKGCKE